MSRVFQEDLKKEKDLNEFDQRQKSFSIRSLDDLEFTRFVKLGSYGIVFQCRFKDIPDCLFCVKLLRPMDDNAYLNNKFNEEVKLPEHPNIVRVLPLDLDLETAKNKILRKLPETVDNYCDYWRSLLRSPQLERRWSHKIGVYLMRYYPKNLGEYLEERKLSGQPFSSSEVCLMLRGLLNGVRFLNQNKIVHRDLHTQNILVDENCGRISITDFGCVLDLRNVRTDGFKIHKEHEKIKVYSDEYNVGGNQEILSPEIKNFDPKNPGTGFLDYSKSDLYSVGVLGLLFFTTFQEKRSKKLGFLNTWLDAGYFIDSTEKRVEDYYYEKFQTTDWRSRFPKRFPKSRREEYDKDCRRIIASNDWSGICDRKIEVFLRKLLEIDVSRRIGYDDSVREIEILCREFGS